VSVLVVAQSSSENPEGLMNNPVVNANYEILHADVGTNGRISDGGVIRNTKFY
jgi:hypothetical protein